MATRCPRQPWSEIEDNIVIGFIGDDLWLDGLKQRLPDRGEQAIRVRMTKMRRLMGCEDARVNDDRDWERKARQASQVLAAATLRVGRWV